MRKDSIRSQFQHAREAGQRHISVRGASAKNGSPSPGRYPLDGKSPLDGKPLLDERAVLHLVRSALGTGGEEASCPVHIVDEKGSPIVQRHLPVGIVQLSNVVTRQQIAEFVVEIDALVAMEDYSIAAISIQTVFGGEGVQTRLTLASDHKALRKRSGG